MAINQLALLRDFGGNNTMIPNVPEYIDARVLAANVAEVYTIPTGADVLMFASDAPFYARANNAAAVPAADVTDGSASDLNPTSYLLRPFGTTGSGAAIATIGLIAPTNAVVTIRVYKLKV